MNNASLELGGTNWAEKDGNILGYSVGDTSGKYSPQEFTFARGSNLSATRIGKTGLIEKGRENVLLQSNQFDTTWGSATSTLTSGQLGYDGTNDAWKIAKNQANAQINQSHSNTSVKTLSIYAKADTLNWIAIVGASGSIGYFDLLNGVVGTTGGSVIDAKIESIGNEGWYRCQVTSAASTSSVTIYPADGNGDISGTSGSVYIQDSQLEQGLAASPYIETTTTSAQAGVLENTPRLNYATGVANPYLLLEPSRTNKVTQSEYINDSTSSWYEDNGADCTPNYAISPEGLKNATRVQLDNSGAYSLTRIFTSFTPDSSNDTASFYAKSNNGSSFNISFLFRDDGFGTVRGNATFNITTEWQRFEFTADCSGASGDVMFLVYNTSGNENWDFLMYGAQVEAGTYPTSYIPTYSVSATRAEDVCSKTDASGEINSTEGVLYAEVSRFDNDSSYNTIRIAADTSESNIVALKFRNVENVFYADIRSNGVLSSTLYHTFSDISQYTKIAVKYKQNDFALWVNGVEVATDTNGNAPIGLSYIQFGQGSGAAEAFKGKIKALQVYKEALTDAELATLTTI